MKQARFIVFEGIDRSGKSTQADMLHRRLLQEGVEAIITHEPGATDIGREIRRILLQSTETIPPIAETLLFEADRNIHVETVIRPALQSGKYVICDRYIYSTVAYQSGGKRVDSNLINSLNEIATNGLQPDIVFLIDIPPEVALKRKGTMDRMEREGIDFLSRVRNSYLELAKQNGNFVVLDGREPIEELGRKIWETIFRH